MDPIDNSETTSRCIFFENFACCRCCGITYVIILRRITLTFALRTLSREMLKLTRLLCRLITIVILRCSIESGELRWWRYFITGSGMLFDWHFNSRPRLLSARNLQGKAIWAGEVFGINRWHKSITARGTCKLSSWVLRSMIWDACSGILMTGISLTAEKAIR